MGVEYGFTEQFGARLRRSCFEGRRRRAGSGIGRKLPDAQHDFSHQLFPGHPVHLFQQHRLEEGQLLQPHGIMHIDVELFESDLVGARVGGDRFAHDLGPMASQARLEEFTLQAQPVGDTC